MSVRVRFAPSNTGHLHMGSVRTALFNYLFARNQDGTFILRIEDTDRERSTDEFTESIIEAMDWLGMSPDEGPVFQTDRLGMYQEHIDRLLEEGRAYRCYCTPEELEEMREKALAEGRKPKYSGKWRDRDDHPEGEPYTVRIKMPQEGSVTIDDMVQGEVTVDVEELDDFIIQRTDGTPTYNFVVVIDDIDMDISHVIRGDDHLNNTFRQVPVYKALGEEPPTFGHLPLLEGLSKRKGSASAQDYRNKGILQEALINYLSRLGWSHGDQEIFSHDELVEYFSFDSVGKSSSEFDEDKLRWVNSEWMKKLDAEELAERWKPFLEDRGFDTDAVDLTEVTDLMRDRADTLVALTDESSYFFSDDFDYDEDAVDQWIDAENADVIAALIDGLDALDEWNSDTVGSVFNDVGDEYDLGLANLAQPSRIALTGATSSPSVFSLVAAFPKDEAVGRLRKLHEGEFQ